MNKIAIIDNEKEKLTKELSEQYSKSIISLEEYERILEYINKLETRKEIDIIEKIIYENSIENKEIVLNQNNKIIIQKTGEKHISVFSWRTTNLKSINGSGGKYISVFGTNRIVVDKLPKGRTVINVTSIFGLTEIIVPNSIKIICEAVPVFAGIFTPNEIRKGDAELPELYITGKAVFGNITIKTIETFQKEQSIEKELEEKIGEKIREKMIHKFEK